MCRPAHGLAIHRPIWIVETTAKPLIHVPDKNEVCILHYEAYSARRRAHWRNLGILTETRAFAEEHSDSELPD